MTRRAARMLRVCTLLTVVSQGLGRELLQDGLAEAPVPAFAPLGAVLGDSVPADGCTTALKPEWVVDGVDDQTCWGGNSEVACRAWEMNKALEAFEETLLNLSMMNFTSDLEDGAKPFTFLLPPEAALQWFESISSQDGGQGAVSGAMLQENLLMHVLEGYHSPSALRRAAELGTSEPLKTVSGEQLDLQLTESGDVSISLHNSVVITVFGSEAASCKSDPPSLLLPISHMLCTDELHGALEDSEFGIPPHMILASRGSNSRSSFLPIALGPIWLAVIFLILAAVVIFKLRQRRKGLDAVREDEGAEVARMAAVDAALVHAMATYRARVEQHQAMAAHIQPPKVLTRLDTTRWAADVLPKQLSQQLSKSLSATADLPYVGSSKMMMTKQRSVLSTQLNCSLDADACGLKQGAECVICFEGVGDHVLLPCGHGGYCGSCSRTMLNLRIIEQRMCPICRAELHTAVQVNLSTPVGAVGDVLAAAVSMSQMSADLDLDEGDMDSSRTLPVVAAHESSSEELSAPQWAPP